jgi:tetratricopeptide (TPR) repeat protein
VGAALLLGTTAIAGTPATPPATPETPIATAKRLTASKETKDRTQALQLLKALAKPGTAPGDEALARYGDLCLRFYAEGEKVGLEEAKRAFTELKEKSHSRWGLKATVGLLRVTAAEGKREEAIKGLDRFLLNQGKDDAFIDAAYFMGCLYAEAQDDLKQLELAKKPLNYALRLLADQKNYYLGDITEEMIRGKLHWINERIREIKAGPLKLAFEKAERLRQAGKYGEAIKLYEWIIKEDPEHILAECSGLRIGQCLFGLKKNPEAVKHLGEFVKAKPLGAYRGHAHLELGDYWLEQEFRAACAEVEYTAILHPEKYAAPDPNKTPDFWKSAIDPKIFQAQPDTNIPNEDPLAAEALQSADPARRKALIAAEIPKDAHETWGEVIPDAHIRLGIVTYMRADFKTADQHFSTSHQMRPDERFGRGVPMGMLLLAEKCRKREMPVPWQMLTVGGDRPRVCLFLAGAYLEGWGTGKALGLFNRVAAGEFKDVHPEQVAYALCQRGEALWRSNDSKGAQETWAKFKEKPYDQTMAAPRALLKLGCTSFTLTQDPKCLATLELIYTKYSNSDAAPLAIFQHANVIWLKEPEKAIALLEYMQRQYPNSIHRYQIPAVIKAFRERAIFLQQWRAKQTQAQPGKA